MVDIHKIPDGELVEDRRASIEDIENCEKALNLGIREYSGKSVMERLRVNRKIVTKIDGEVERRLNEKG